MKFFILVFSTLLFAACANAPTEKPPVAPVDAKKYAKCEAAWTKLMKDKPSKAETPPNMISEKAEPEATKPGCAVITYEITKDGLAENFKVVEKSDEEAQKAALGALLKYKFRKFEAKNQAIKFTF